MAQLSEVRMIMLQFSFSNPRLVLPMVQSFPPEATEGADKRRAVGGSGEQFLPTTKNVLAKWLPQGLKAAGWQLISAICQERLDRDRPWRKYWRTRFYFGRLGQVVGSPMPRNSKFRIERELEQICELALWRVQGYLNPDPKGGNRRLACLNFDCRRPLYEADDPARPAKERRRDATGRPVGEPFPLAPTGLLWLAGEEIFLRPMEPDGSVH